MAHFVWLCLLQIVHAQRRSAHATATAQSVCGTTKKKMKTHTAQGRVDLMNKNSDIDGQKKREKIQLYFWNIVGAVEHISLPKLEDAIKKEFNTGDDRVVQNQIRLMQTESRVRVQSRVKVWIKQPNTPR